MVRKGKAKYWSLAVNITQLCLAPFFMGFSDHC